MGFKCLTYQRVVLIRFHLLLLIIVFILNTEELIEFEVDIVLSLHLLFKRIYLMKPIKCFHK